MHGQPAMYECLLVCTVVRVPIATNNLHSPIPPLYTDRAKSDYDTWLIDRRIRPALPCPA
jgi:hypothetical protein